MYNLLHCRHRRGLRGVDCPHALVPRPIKQADGTWYIQDLAIRSACGSQPPRLRLYSEKSVAFELTYRVSCGGVVHAISFLNSALRL